MTPTIPTPRTLGDVLPVRFGRDGVRSGDGVAVFQVVIAHEGPFRAEVSTRGLYVQEVAVNSASRLVRRWTRRLEAAGYVPLVADPDAAEFVHVYRETERAHEVA